MMNLLAQACTAATLASAAFAGRTEPYTTAPAPTVKDPCAAHGNVTAWKISNGDQTPGLAAAFIPAHQNASAGVSGYVCNAGKCVSVSVVPPANAMSPADYLEFDPNFGYRALDIDLGQFAALQNLAISGNETDACFGYHLTRAFAGQPVFQTIATNQDVTLATSAAFLQSFWSKIPNLSDSLQHYPEQVPVYYNLISGYRGNCSQALGNFIGSSQRP